LWVEAAGNPDMSQHLGGLTELGDCRTAGHEPLWQFKGAELSVRRNEVWGLFYPQLDVPVGPNEWLALLGESGGERPVVKPDPVVTWVEGLEGASVRGVDQHVTGTLPASHAGEEVDLSMDLGFVGDWAGNQSEAMVYTHHVPGGNGW
jgi:hypothetical protein